MHNDIVVRIGHGHNTRVVVLRDYDGPRCLNERFLKALQQRLTDEYGEYAWKVECLDHIEILNPEGTP